MTIDQEYRLLMGKHPKEWMIKVLEEEHERSEHTRKWVKMMATEILDWIETEMEIKEIAHALGGVHFDPPHSKKPWTSGPWSRTWKPYCRW